MQENNTKQEVGDTLYLRQAKERMLVLFEKLRKLSYPNGDAPFPGDVYVDKKSIDMAVRMVSDYCNFAQKLIPIIDANTSSIAENHLGVGPIDTLKFTQLFYCLGVIYQYDNEAIEIAAHLTPNTTSTEMLLQYAEMLDDTFKEVSGGKLPTRVLFFNSKLADNYGEISSVIKQKNPGLEVIEK